ncbi:hypothetical protein HDU76_008160, partial [Blyttiomyces sp. JEL0837]
SCAQGTPNNNCGGGGGNGGGGGSGGGWNSILIKGGQKALDFPTPNGSPSAQGTQLQIWGPTGVGQQLYQFQPSPVGGNSFQIVNKLTGWCLDLSGFHTENKSPVGLWPCTGASNQAFTLPAVQGGNWIRGVASNRCLAVSTLGMNDGDKIFIWDCENNPNPQTIVWGINGNAPGNVGGGGGNGGGGGGGSGGSFNSILIKGGQKAIVFRQPDFPTPNGPSPQGTQLQVWSSTGAGQQLFQFQPSPVGGNSFQIVNKLTGWCIDLSGFHTENKSPVGLWPCTGASNQAFTLPAVQGGNWIRGVASGRCLAVSTLGMNDGDKIFIWDCDNNPNPQTIVWGINGNSPTTPTPGPQPDGAYGGIWQDPKDNLNGQLTKAIYGYDLPGWGDDKQFSGTNLGTCYAQLVNANDDFMTWSNGNCYIKKAKLTLCLLIVQFDSPYNSQFSMATNNAALMMGYDMFGHFDAPGGSPLPNVNNQAACESFCAFDSKCIGVTWGGNNCYKKYPQPSGDPNSVLTFNWAKLQWSCLNPRIFLSDPVWAGDTITIYNPKWPTIVLKALQDCDFNVQACSDIDVSEIFQEGNTAKQFKVTVSLGGTGHDAANCAQTTNLIG